jgi:phosphoserine phosphatase
MHLIIQGQEVETAALKQLAKLSGASAIEQIAPNVFRLLHASPAAAIAELCARQELEWAFVPEDPGAPPSGGP